MELKAKSTHKHVQFKTILIVHVTASGCLPYPYIEHQTTIAEEPVRPVSAQDMESDTFEDLIEMRPRAESYSGEKPSHVRAKSDITDLIQYMRMEEGQGGSPTLLSPVSSPTSEGPYPSLGGISGDEGRPESSEGVSGVEEDRPFAIDVVNEVNVTINMDSGIIILRTERYLLPCLPETFIVVNR